MIGYNVDNNINNNNNIFPNNQASIFGNKLNILFKTTHGKSFMILFDFGRTVEDLILTFFKRINQEYLFHQGGVFSYIIFLILDINNLIGASYY